ncbi:hypothetical protein BDW62DRAFT_207233 [Aspergillus aurantiobrunneus]
MARQNVVVIGATGSQGGSVVAELLQHRDRYHIRALTCDPTKGVAQALAKRGVEVQRADLDDSKEALAAVFAGAHGILALTDFWQKQSIDAEIQQGKAIVDAAAMTTTLQHLVWSALPDPVAL